MTTGLQPSDSTCKKQLFYHLGKIVFSFRNCDASYSDCLNMLLPRFDGDELSPDLIQHIDTGCSKDVFDLIRHVGTRHHAKNCVWIEGSCLISPKGHKVLIAGRAKSGKSTTAAALALGREWKMLAENYCIIDYETNHLWKFFSPVSFDDISLPLLKSFGVIPEQTFSLEWRKNRVWAPVEDLIGNAAHAASFDLAVWLDRSEECAPEFSTAEISAAEFSRKILAVSNLLKIKGSYESFVESLSSARCLTLTGGGLEQRIETITEALKRIEQ